MEQIYNDKMTNLGYTKFVCDIFPKWEIVKDELLIPDRKSGSGNGTIHVFLGAADSELRKEFPTYYSAVANGEQPSEHAVKVNHFFLASNLISLIGYICQYDLKRNIPFTGEVREILNYINSYQLENGLLETSSLFKLSTGSSKLRPYFKQFENSGVFTKIVRKILLPNSSYKISLYKNDKGEYAAFWLIGFEWQTDFEADSTSVHFHKKIEEVKNTSDKALQIIYYGAPGTGKSHAIKTDTKGEHVVRTTFHPDSDYSTFVGAYKPTTKPSYVRDSTGRVVEERGEKVVEDRIVYEFVPQAFLQAYVDAWRYYAKAENEEPEKQYLVIEEINRGNCAQIFGDLFQLLDRNDEGYSEYPISADKDMEKYLSDAFRDIAIPNEEKLADLFDDPFIAHKIGLGQVLVLPPNLYIWATMNTSDQSLFPIDSAFKRRWDWRYIPISEATDEKTKQPLGWSIHVGNKDYDWWSFLQAINDKIGGLTNSRDKKLGYFFCKAKNGMIDAETLVGKVFFFLWNEVLKDFEQEQDFLKDGVNGYISFDDFYYVDNTGKTLVNENKVDILLNNLGVRETVKNMPEDVDNPTEASPATKDLYKNFWSGFNESYEDSGEFKRYFTNPNGLPQSWLNLGGLNRKYYLALTLSVKNKVASIQLYFPNGESEFDKYNSEVNLDKMKERINGIIVHNTQDTKCKYFSIEKPFDITKDNRQDVYDWYHKNAVIFKQLCDEIDPK